MKMSRLKRNLAIAFVCCVTLGICAVGFAQSGEEEETVQGDLDKYTLQMQEDIEAMMACGEDCADISIEPPSFEEMIKDMQENGVSQSDEQSSVSYEGDSTRSGICSSTSSTITCTDGYSEFYTYVAGGIEYGTSTFIVCASQDGTNWVEIGAANRTTQTTLYLNGAAQSESIGIVRNAQWLDECHFDDFPDYFTTRIDINGNGGTDTVHGSQYDDYLTGEYVLGNEDIDHIYLTWVSGITPGAWGGYGNDVIAGTNHADYVEGNANTDYIYGFGLNDGLYGGDGNDYLYGGSGSSDVCNGGNGTDTCDADCESVPQCE
jgi:Ca2+-binding RTX toxin-like protein